MMSSSVQLDPLDSPHPVPWNWVLANLSEPGETKIHYYRSQSLISPDQQYAAYSRIQLHVDTVPLRSRVSSVLFVENLRTGELRTVTALSPLSENPFITTRDRNLLGSVAILIPIAWSANSDRILAREFESLLGSDVASDYAVVWDRSQNRASTVAPTRIHYTNAVLLGWSQLYPDRVLFRAGNMGDTSWPLWSVDVSGQTLAASEDRPQIFGHRINSLWTGPQLQRL